MRSAFRLMVALFPLFGRRMRVQGRPLLLLTTVGAKSGAERKTVLGWFPDGDDWLVVASNGGSARNPAWLLNMARNPDPVWIEIDKSRYKVQPDSLAGAEREEAWRQVVSLAPGYAEYQVKTDRQIPIVRLRPDRSAVPERPKMPDDDAPTRR